MVHKPSSILRAVAAIAVALPLSVDECAAGRLGKVRATEWGDYDVLFEEDKQLYNRLLERDIGSLEVPAAAAKTVYIIRHGEKIWVPTNETAYHYACLSNQGWSRAYHMLTVFGRNPKAGLKTPDRLFSYNYDDSSVFCQVNGWYRTQQVIEPLARSLDLAVDNSTGSKPSLCGTEFGSECDAPQTDGNVDYGPCCNVAAAAAIKSTLMEDGVDSVLAAWEHTNIDYLANALGANNCTYPGTTDPVPGCNMTWPGFQFDSIYALHFDPDTGDFLSIDTNLLQGFDWIGPVDPGTQDYDLGPGEYPGIN